MRMSIFCCIFAANFEKEVIMQVAINPTLYGDAQVFAERRGLNINQMIDDFLANFVQSISKNEDKAQKRSIEVSPRVANLLSGHSWDIPDEDLDDIRYKYLAEKYK